MLTEVPAIEWARRGVNAIAPGSVETEMVKDLAAREVLDHANQARRTRSVGW